MPLPSFFQRFRSGAQTPAPQVQPLSPADIEQARVRARRRMIGMAVLVGAGVIGFPWLFETQPRPLATDIQVVNASAPAANAVPATRLASGKVTQVPAEPVVPPQVSRALDAEGSAKVAERAEAATSPREELVEDAPVPRSEPRPEARKPEPKKPEPKPEARPAAKPVATPSKPEAAKPAQKPSAPTVAATKPTDKKPVAAAKPESKPDAKAAAKDSKDDADTRYIVQVGAFADTTAAHAARMKVERLGIKTYTQAVDTPGGKKIRVRVGPYVNKAEADKAMAALRKAGLTGALLTL